MGQKTPKTAYLEPHLIRKQSLLIIQWASSWNRFIRKAN